MAKWQANKEARQSAYSEKLKDPRWQKKRLEVLQRDEWRCQVCGDDTSTLHVHHLSYERGKDPWDYLSDLLMTLCAECHEYETDARPAQEELVLKMLRERGFMSDDLIDIGSAIFHLPMLYVPDVMASVLDFALSDKDQVREMTERYFVMLAERRREREARQAILTAQEGTTQE